MRFLLTTAVALWFAPGLAYGSAPVVGVGELSCSKEIEEAICTMLTDRLVSTLASAHSGPVVRQSTALEQQRGCAKDPTCLIEARVSYQWLVSGTVRAAESQGQVSLRVLDAKRMKKLGEREATSATLDGEELGEAVDAAARELLR